MFNDAVGFRKIYLAVGYTDLRRGMEGLAAIVKHDSVNNFSQIHFQPSAHHR